MTPALLSRLSQVWAEKRPGFESGLRRGATAEELAAFEGQLGLPLPSAFQLLYGWHDGAADEHEAFEGRYGFFSLAGILKHKAMLDEIRGGDGTWEPAWVPFMQDNYSDVICIDTVSGEVFEWFNSEPVRRLLAPSLDEWLAAHVAITEWAASLAGWQSVHAAFHGAEADAIRARLSPGCPRELPLDMQPNSCI